MFENFDQAIDIDFAHFEKEDEEPQSIFDEADDAYDRMREKE